MPGNSTVIYPMLGVGAFFGMFWVGFVVAYELGLPCSLILLNALTFACLGSYSVVRMESHERTRSGEGLSPGVLPMRTESVRIADGGLREPNFVTTRVPRRLGV